ncbi:MAG: hypothetical protein IPL98_02315 [Saprospiraceae bacterium]|nr:hypothetical protein [Saprospiraceae bacterium]
MSFGCLIAGMAQSPVQDTVDKVYVVHADLFDLRDLMEKEFQYLSDNVIVKHNKLFFIM